MARKTEKHRLRGAQRRVVLEACVESVADAKAAAEGGADRIELNSALVLDGLTPSIGLVAEVRRAVGPRCPVIAMARPRAGDFCYDDSDFRVMVRDVDLLLEHGADGIAFGVLTENLDVDVRRCPQVIKLVKPGAAAAVFHRAFDRVRDPFRALEQLIDLGIRRVMTSGQQPTALRGATLIAQLIERAAGRIEILPAGGIRPSNARAILSRIGCDQLHTSLRQHGTGGMSRQLLKEMVAALDGVARRA